MSLSLTRNVPTATPPAQQVASVPVLATPESLYLSGLIGLVGQSVGLSAAVSLAQSGGTLFDTRLAILTLTNPTGQTITAASLILSDTIGGILVTDTYNAVAVGVAANGSGRFLVPLPLGPALKNLQISVTLAGAVTGNVGYILSLLGPTAPSLTNQPPVTVTILSTLLSVQIIAAPGAGQSLYIRGVALSNTSGTIDNVTLQEGPGGTARYSVAIAPSGGGWVQAMHGIWRLPTNTGLFAQCGSAVTDVRVNVTDWLIGP